MFVDGEYARKIFKKQNFRLDVPGLVKKVLAEAGIDDQLLLRVYFYTAPPYQSTNPTADEKQRYGQFMKWKSFLEKQDNFEIKLGRTERRGPDYEQKMVDVLLSIDLVELSAKSRIRTAILLAGDSDLVPAVKKAKDNGVKVILCCSEDKHEYHRELWMESDKRIHLTTAIMSDSCCGKTLA